MVWHEPNKLNKNLGLGSQGGPAHRHRRWGLSRGLVPTRPARWATGI